MHRLQLDVRRVAAGLNVPENTIYRWINERNLPAHGVEGRYRFARAELLEWATKNNVNLSLDIFDDGLADCDGLPLTEALEGGGIFYDVRGADASAVLRSVIDNIVLPEGCDVELLLQLFLAREAMGSTAVGNGVAIPHARHPVVLPIAKPLLSLCFLAQPIEFGARSGEPVHTLFVLLSPTILSHLQILARIAGLLRDDRFGQVLSARKPRREILSEVRRAEQASTESMVAKGSEH